MKSEGEIRQKIKQAQYRHVKRILCSRFPPGEDWPKDEVDKIKAEYRDFFATSPIHVIAKDYPDVAALMWVLQEQPDQPLVVNGSLVGRMGGVMLWADTDDDASRARTMIDRVVDAATREPEAPQLPVPVKRSWWQRLFG
jgi:hypothetical protein